MIVWVLPPNTNTKFGVVKYTYFTPSTAARRGGIRRFRPPRAACAGHKATVGGQETERAAAWVVVDLVDRLVVLTVGRALDSREVDRDHQDVVGGVFFCPALIRRIEDAREDLSLRS